MLALVVRLETKLYSYSFVERLDSHFLPILIKSINAMLTSWTELISKDFILRLTNKPPQYHRELDKKIFKIQKYYQ